MALTLLKKKHPARAKKAIRNKASRSIHLPDDAAKSPMPESVSPMLATLVDRPFNHPGWIFEVKWDGYRAIALVDGPHVELRSRNQKSFSEKFYPVRDALKVLDRKAVLDGEIVVLNEKGQADFGSLQNWRSEEDGTLIYYVFDLLWLNGRDLRSLPLLKRREILSQVVPKNDPLIRYSEGFPSDGIRFFQSAKRLGLEGIMAKKGDSPYLEGTRSPAWLKIKSALRQEVVIGGYTRNRDSPKVFSSLLVGVYRKKALSYAGKIGTGFSDQVRKDLLARFRTLKSAKCPFERIPDVNSPSRFRPDPPHADAHWLKPQLVCEVDYLELTADGLMRHPSFQGLRADKKPRQVILERPAPIDQIDPVKPRKKNLMVQRPTPGKGPKTLLNPSEASQTRVVEGHELKFTHLDKIYWPADQINKRDLLNYYHQMAPFILPYLTGRPQTLNRFPNGIGGKAFYQKDVTGKVPDWMETFLYHSGTENQDKHFLVCSGEASLLYMANLGAIEINPWSSRVDRPDNPDWCVLDLDPDRNTFNQVIQAARVARKVLEGIGITSFPKTSGSTGIHIYIPLGAKYTYGQSREFARMIAGMVHEQTEKFTSMERSLEKRKGKMYLDFLQNRPQATLAAPYSLRPKPGATVSMPLDWDEVKPGLKMKDFTIFNAVARVRREGDLFRGVLGKGISMEKACRKAGSPFPEI